MPVDAAVERMSMRTVGRRIVQVLSLVALVGGGLVVGQAGASATGDFGYNTCLEGYVWREAFAGDDVCVTPDRRQQTWDENAQAASLVDPQGGCIAGHVRRDAGLNNPYIFGAVDDSCVTPDIRDAVRAENEHAVDRQLFMSFGFASTTSPFVVDGEGFNNGWVWVGFYRNDDGSLVWGTWVMPTLGGGLINPRIYGFQNLQTPVGNCGGAQNAYLITFDSVAGKWSASVPVTVC
jgi:hypothetical protein